MVTRWTWVLAMVAAGVLAPALAEAQILYDVGLCTGSEWLMLENVLRNEGLEVFQQEFLTTCYGSYFNAQFYFYVWWSAGNWFATDAEILNWWFGYVFSATGG